MNYAELQARFDRGEFTDAECERLGSTHRAYGWSCTPPGHFTEDQKAAYLRGFHGSDK
jgi:hypothetical protein